MRSVQKLSNDILWKIGTFIEEDARHNKYCTEDNDTSVPFKVGTLRPHTILPITISCPSYFPESQWLSKISSLSKVILVLGKARSCRVPNLGCSGAESPGWFNVVPKNSARDMMHEWVHCRDKAASHQLPIAAAFWIAQIVSMKERSNLMQNLM